MALYKDVEAPIDVVWAIITDLERSPDVITAIADIERLDDGTHFDVGTRWRETRTMFGRAATEELEVTAIVPGTSYTVEADGPGAHYISTMRLEEADEERTRLHVSFEAQPDGVVSKLLANTVGRLLLGSTRKALQKDLEDIAMAATS